MNKKQQYQKPEIEIAYVEEITNVLEGTGLDGPSEAPSFNINFDENEGNEGSEGKGNFSDNFDDKFKE